MTGVIARLGLPTLSTPDNPPLIHHRRGDIHHRAGFIMRIAARTARRYWPPRRVEPDIVPARIVLPCRLPAGVKHHLAPGIGQIDAWYSLRTFFNSANIGVERLLVELVKGLRQRCPAAGLPPASDPHAPARQQGSGIIEGPLSVARRTPGFTSLDKDRQHKPRGDRDDKKNSPAAGAC